MWACLRPGTMGHCPSEEPSLARPITSAPRRHHWVCMGQQRCRAAAGGPCLQDSMPARTQSIVSGMPRSEGVSARLEAGHAAQQVAYGALEQDPQPGVCLADDVGAALPGDRDGRAPAGKGERVLLQQHRLTRAAAQGCLTTRTTRTSRYTRWDCHASASACQLSPTNPAFSHSSCLPVGTPQDAPVQPAHGPRTCSLILQGLVDDNKAGPSSTAACSDNEKENR